MRAFWEKLGRESDLLFLFLIESEGRRRRVFFSSEFLRPKKKRKKERRKSAALPAFYPSSWPFLSLDTPSRDQEIHYLPLLVEFLCAFARKESGARVKKREEA